MRSIWDGTTYRRVVVVAGRPTELAVRQEGSPDTPRLAVTATEKGVPHIWRVDTNGHDTGEMSHSLYHLAQKLFKQ